MKHKSDVHSLKALQADNGTEFINSATISFLAQHGVQLRLSCPYTSPQNGTAERMLRTLNNSVRTLLFHASMPAAFWVEALHAACLLINRLPCTRTPDSTPFSTTNNRPTTTCVSSAASAILTQRPLPLTNSHPARPLCLSWLPLYAQGLPLS
jgi:transposase InsO family protein